MAWRYTLIYDYCSEVANIVTRHAVICTSDLIYYQNIFSRCALPPDCKKWPHMVWTITAVIFVTWRWTAVIQVLRRCAVFTASLVTHCISLQLNINYMPWWRHYVVYSVRPSVLPPVCLISQLCSLLTRWLENWCRDLNEIWIVDSLTTRWWTGTMFSCYEAPYIIYLLWNRTQVHKKKQVHYY